MIARWIFSKKGGRRGGYVPRRPLLRERVVSMQLQITALALLLSFFWSPGQGQAAPIQPYETCAIIGVVQIVEPRSVQRNEGLAVAWGISSTREFVAVDMTVSDSVAQGTGGINNCPDKLGDHSFTLSNQLANAFRREYQGKCIRGLAKLSGDEFGVSDLLFEVAIAEPSLCDPAD